MSLTRAALSNGAAEQGAGADRACGAAAHRQGVRRGAREPQPSTPVLTRVSVHGYDLHLES